MPGLYARTVERPPSSHGFRPGRHADVCLYAHQTSNLKAIRPVGRRHHSWPQRSTAGCSAAATSDDKGGFAVHLAALRAFGGKPPVGVTLFIEGRGRSGQPVWPSCSMHHREELAADVFVIADSGNWAVGNRPSTSLADCGCTVKVAATRTRYAAGGSGGVVPDALTALCRLLATLHDDQGNVAVPGLATAPSASPGVSGRAAPGGGLDSLRRHSVDR